MSQQQRGSRATQVYKIDELEFDFIRRAPAEALKDRRQPVLVCKGAVDERCLSQNNEQDRATQRKFCRDGIVSANILTRRVRDPRNGMAQALVTSTIKSEGTW
jgi:hypothetical protein